MYSEVLAQNFERGFLNAIPPLRGGLEKDLGSKTSEYKMTSQYRNVRYTRPRNTGLAHTPTHTHTQTHTHIHTDRYL